MDFEKLIVWQQYLSSETFLMKTIRSVSIQIFLYQLLLFWWAYCSLFPWHPAAILQLLIFTIKKRERKKKRGPLWFLLNFQPRTFGCTNSRYRRSDRKSPLSSANEQPQDYCVNSKTRTWKHSLLLVSRLKTKKWSPADWAEVMAMPDAIRKQLALMVHSVYVG